jgi:hypothetical protein
MSDGDAFNQTFMIGDQCAKWVVDAEKYVSLLRAAE